MGYPSRGRQGAKMLNVSDGSHKKRWEQFGLGRAATRVALLNNDLYVVHGAKNVAEIFRNPSVGVAPAYGIALKHCFGMSRKAAQTYFADTSGSRPRPIWGSNVQPRNRVMYRTHENLLQGLLGSGLAPATDRFERYWTDHLCSMDISSHWVEYPDLPEFFEANLGKIVVQAIFGPALLSQSPGFVRDMWAFDQVVMSLAKRLPWICIPQAYIVRRRLFQYVKRWHTFAKASSPRAEDVQEDDVNAFWGSKTIRERYEMLLDVESQDQDSVASTDLGFIWAAVTNVVPSAMTLTLQVCKNATVRSELREDLAQMIEPDCRLKFDLQKLEKHPLLLSMYAETLRFGVQIHVPRNAPHADIAVGNVQIPQSKLMVMNTWLAHTDETVWNTKKGSHPLDGFWPQRFLVDPKDPSSGPTKKGYGIRDRAMKTDGECGNAFFSTEGLEGAWIPFGGRGIGLP
ncbi:MAG: hypothetical protein Q9185_005585 [Variospora sp. 1 TL-2023]